MNTHSKTPLLLVWRVHVAHLPPVRGSYARLTSNPPHLKAISSICQSADDHGTGHHTSHMPILTLRPEEGGAEQTIQCDSCTTFLDLRYQLFFVTDIPAEHLLLHFSDRTRSPHDDIDRRATLEHAAITSPTILSYSRAYKSDSIATSLSNLTVSSIANEMTSLDHVNAALHTCESHTPMPSPERQKATREFLAKVYKYYVAAVSYEDNALQKKALNVVPLQHLKNRATEQFNSRDTKYPTYEHCLTKQLLHWFKHSFFTWIDKPKCWSCGEKTVYVETLPPSESEAKFRASRTEKFRCERCGAETRFARYNDAGKLLETRRGRCGEWAQAFMLIVRAAGMQARAVHDWTDHVWTEVWCGRWVHADSCEDTIDEPLLYEKGWKKKLNYCIATSVDSVVDVTRRYTEDFEALRERRTLADEAMLQQGLSKLNAEALRRLTENDRVGAVARYMEDVKQMHGHSAANSEEVELPGRKSGASAWVQSRGEDG